MRHPCSPLEYAWTGTQTERFYPNRRNGSVIATLGLLFKKDAPGHLNQLSMALLSGKIGGMPVVSKYESAGKKTNICLARKYNRASSNGNRPSTTDMIFRPERAPIHIHYSVLKPPTTAS